MMNNKGQILILFIILVPVLLIFATFVLDVGNAIYTSNKINNINKTVIKYGLNNLDDEDVDVKMMSLLYENDNDIDDYKLDIENNKVSLRIKKTTNSIFGKAIGIELFSIDSLYVGYVNDQGKIVIEKGH